tara:strand:- start:627 stop:857 length:231 start_codon:yes stop_codon:yes gene_type:complete
LDIAIGYQEVLMILIRTAMLALGVVYGLLGVIFIESMESTKVADLGHYYPDVVAFGIAMTCFVFSIFALASVAFQK